MLEAFNTLISCTSLDMSTDVHLAEMPLNCTKKHFLFRLLVHLSSNLQFCCNFQLDEKMLTKWGGGGGVVLGHEPTPLLDIF